MIKIKKYTPYLLIALASLLVFVRPFGSGDELWNYSFARNIANGLLPYKDFNIIQTPLSAYVSAAFIFAFGDKLISYRIAGYLLCVAIFCLFYYICKIKSNSVLITSIFTVFVMGLQMICFIYNYNYLNVFIILVIMFLILNKKKVDTIWINIAIGILIGITPLIKQSTGFFIMMANVFSCLIEFFMVEKEKRRAIFQFLSSLFPIVLFMTIIHINGTIKDFYEYAIRGIRTFSHRFTLVELAKETPISFVLFLLFFVLLAYSIVSMIKYKQFLNEYENFFLSVASITVIYPLCDSVHLFCALITIVPFILPFIKPKHYKQAEIYICCFISIVVAVISIIATIPMGDEYEFSYINKYYGIVSTKHMNKVIKSVDAYILSLKKEGYKVRIVDDSASAYMLPLNDYEKNWSMLLVGNIGDSSIEDLLCESQKCKYLVFKNTDLLSMQNHFELIKYIKNNYKCTGEIECFDVYEKVEGN